MRPEPSHKREDRRIRSVYNYFYYYYYYILTLNLIFTVFCFWGRLTKNDISRSIIGIFKHFEVQCAHL